MRLGLLAYLAYSYLIYVTGVPMNRMFLAYVGIVALSGAGLVGGLVEVVERPSSSVASRRLRLGTGWMLVVTVVLFAGLWLSALLPFALGGARPEPEGVGGTPYPVFWLDLAVVLPAIAAVGLLLLRNRPAGPALAVVALVKIITLFTALWAGPLIVATTGGDVVLGPDAGPSLVLLAVSSWLVVRWSRIPATRGRPGRPGRTALTPSRRPSYRRRMDEPITRMSAPQCWDFLRRHELGRLAFHLADEVHIVPVNYAVDHDPASDRRSLLFRTAEGSKLLGVVMNADVAFEVDELVEERRRASSSAAGHACSRRTRRTGRRTCRCARGWRPRSGTSSRSR